MVKFCHIIHQDAVFQQLLTTKEKFDLIVIEGILNECVLPLVGVHKVPFVYLLSNAPIPWLLNAIDSPQAYDHYPATGSRFTDEMNLLQRTINAMCFLGISLYRNCILMPAVDNIANELLSHRYNLSSLSVKEIEDEYLSLLVTKSSPGLTYGMPKSAGFIEAGGIHCVPSQPLPDDLEAFVNGSGDDGFIIVSFGTLLRGSGMPDKARNVFLKTFARIRQRVLWKWEIIDNEDLKMIPRNVKLLPWLPQQDLLGHPKARLLINHGGMTSIEEAVYHRVPLIVLPVFGDQTLYADKMHYRDGYGISIEWDNLNEDVLFDAIQEILNNPK